MRNGASSAVSAGRAITQMPTSTTRALAAFVEAGQHPPALAAQHEVDPPPLARLAEQRRLESRRRDAALLQRALDQADLPGACRRRAASAAARSRRTR